MTKDNGKRNVRLVKRGDVIKLRDGGAEEVVRGVQIILQMANGNNEVYEPTETVDIVPPEELPDLGDAK
jgi:hypothetical protein